MRDATDPAVRIYSHIAKDNAKDNQLGESAIEVSDFYGSALENQSGPQGFLVESPPGRVNGAHFHTVEQFQIYFASEGAWYQRHELTADVIHFTDPYTVYGPFGSYGPEPLRFFTLRARSSTETAFMPEDREKLIQKGPRNIHRSIDAVSGLVGPGECLRTTIIEPQPDGLAAWLLVGGAESEMNWDPPTHPSSGQFYCVLGGAARQGASAYRRRALGWRECGASFEPLICESDDVCRLVVMQLPRPYEAGEAPGW
jgi:hypothetical protein